MPRPTTAARRYAEACFELADRDGSHDRWSDDLGLGASLVVDERVAAIVDNPAVPYQDRESTLEDLLGNRVSRPAFNLVRLLAQRRRLDLLPRVAREFDRLLDQRNGVVGATVTSASRLEPSQEDAVRPRLDEM